MEHYAIIGSGLAGTSAAHELLELGFQGHINLISQENHMPYDRPPLSKEYLIGESAEGDIRLYDPDFYQQPQIDLLLDSTVEQIIPKNSELVLSDRRRFAYDKLLIATGCRPRKLDPAQVPGADLEGIYQAVQKESPFLQVGDEFLLSHP